MTSSGEVDWKDAEKRFLEHLPRIREAAEMAFASENAQQQELVHETFLNVWKTYRKNCASRRLNPDRNIDRLIVDAIQDVQDGHFIDGRSSETEVLSQRCQQGNGFEVAWFSDSNCHPNHKKLRDKQNADVPDQVAFKLDLQEWMDSLPPRYQLLVERSVQGDSTAEIAPMIHVTPRRVSGIRHTLQKHYRNFQEGDERQR